jgi:predicted nucleic acid-binding protein
MKKITFFLTMVLAASFVHAQYDDIKQNLILGKYKDAKAEVDKKMTNAKFASKAEAYILKATVYASLAADSATLLTPEVTTLQAEAMTAFKKYQEMQPSMELVKDMVYKNAPINLYSSLYTTAAKYYEKEKWVQSFETFKKVGEIGDVLIKNKLIGVAMDTSVIFNIAYTAENAKLKDDAAQYYKQLADIKIGGQNFERVYHFLVIYCFDKKDMAGFEKYKALGHELYPANDLFTYDKTDFAVGLEENYDAKVKALEALSVSEPDNERNLVILAQLIYDTLYSAVEKPVKHPNAAQLETVMTTALTKAIALKPEDESANMMLGNHYINKSVGIDEEKTALAAEIKKRTKPGAQTSKEDLAKKAEIEKLYADALESARVPYEKAAEIYSKKDKLNSKEKQLYKYAVSYLGDIYTYKRENAKGKPADLAKFTAEEKKWNDLYATMK